MDNRPIIQPQAKQQRQQGYGGGAAKRALPGVGRREYPQQQGEQRAAGKEAELAVKVSQRAGVRHLFARRMQESAALRGAAA